jgi:hypothetical protein
MPETKITSTNSIGPSAVDTDAIIDDKVTSSKLATDISPPSAISAPQLSSTLDLTGKTVTFSAPQISPHAPTSQVETNIFNIGILGFKMAVNEGLTVYNLVDGVVDEFNDETGVDTPENSNATYDSTSDFYSNQVAGDIPAPQVGRQVLTGHTFENQGEGTYTVESGVTAVDLLIVGGGGGGFYYSGSQGSGGAGGGGLIHVTDYEVTPGSTISYIIGSGGSGRGGGIGIAGYFAPSPNFPPSQTSPYAYSTDGSLGSHKYVYEAGSDAPYYPQISPFSGGGGQYHNPSTQVGTPPGPAEFSGEYGDPNPANFHPHNIDMSFGRDTIWNDGQPDSATTTDESPTSRTYFSKLTGMGGGLSDGYADGRSLFGGSGAGGATPGDDGTYGPPTGGEGFQGLLYPAGPGISPGAPEEGDMPSLTGNVVGSFGSDGGNGEGPPPNSQHAAGGGGSGEAGHSGAGGNGGDGLTFTMADGSTPIAYGAGGGGSNGEGGNEGANGGDGTEPAHSGTAGRGNGAGGTYGSTGIGPGGVGGEGGSGTIIVVESRQLVTNTSLTLISDTFTANTTPTKARIVVFAELPDGTGDFAVSATRDNTTFNAITLTDEGFETGSSGTKIFTGSTPLTGTASPQVALRWKIVGSSLTGANKIHGVALQWA